MNETKRAVIECMLMSLRARKECAEGYLYNTEMQVEIQLLQKQIEVLEKELEKL